MSYFAPARAIAGLAAASTAALIVSSAFAQQPPAPATPRATTPARPPAAAPVRPAAPAPVQPVQPAPGAPPAQGAGAANPQAQQMIYTQWIKLCVLPDGTPADPKDAAAKAKQVCHTSIEARLESGVGLLALAIIDPPPEAQQKEKILRVHFPTGMHLQHGTRMIIDQATPQQAPYVTCYANVCLSQYAVDADTLGKLKKGQVAYVQGILATGAALSVPVPLTEFAKVFDGPPTDPKAMEDQKKKMEDELKRKGEELQKKALEARQKLEQGGTKPQ